MAWLRFMPWSGNTAWMPLVRRRSRPVPTASLPAASSVQAPAAMITMPAETSVSSPVKTSRARTPVTRPAGSRCRATTSEYERHRAPAAWASSTFSRTSRASSVQQS